MSRCGPALGGGLSDGWSFRLGQASVAGMSSIVRLPDARDPRVLQIPSRLYEVQRSALDLVIDPSDVLADDPDRDELDPAEKQDDDRDRPEPGKVVTQQAQHDDHR